MVLDIDDRSTSDELQGRRATNIERQSLGVMCRCRTSRGNLMIMLSGFTKRVQEFVDECEPE